MQQTPHPTSQEPNSIFVGGPPRILNGRLGSIIRSHSTRQALTLGRLLGFELHKIEPEGWVFTRNASAIAQGHLVACELPAGRLVEMLPMLDQAAGKDYRRVPGLALAAHPTIPGQDHPVKCWVYEFLDTARLANLPKEGELWHQSLAQN
jgi:hypothetical protein